jgi:hypothetical protein
MNYEKTFSIKVIVKVNGEKPLEDVNEGTLVAELIRRSKQWKHTIPWKENKITAVSIDSLPEVNLRTAEFFVRDIKVAASHLDTLLKKLR